MRILLIDFDSKIPNLPLMKLSEYYQQRGHQAGFDIENPDRIYVSLIFPENRAQAAGLTTMYPGTEMIFGGTGWDLHTVLPEEIELGYPDYNLYPSSYFQGFTTRGCPRICPFCFVPEKEGKIREVQHPREFYNDDFKEGMLMDNNLFGASIPWVKEVLSWFERNGLKMRDHGFDARLLTEEYAGMLKDIKHHNGVRFAWDNTNYESSVIKAIHLLKNAGFNLKHDVSFYVLAGCDLRGYNPSLEDALYRCNRLKEMGVSAFVMKYHKNDAGLNRLAKWANRRWAYWSKPFEAII